MKLSSWVVAFASGALFAAAIAVALVLVAPGTTPIPMALEPSTGATTSTSVLGAPDGALKQAGPTTTAKIAPDPPGTGTTTRRTDASAPANPVVTESVSIVIAGDGAVAHPVADGCRWKETEWDRREDAGEIDWDRMFPDHDVDDPDSVWLEPEPVDGRVRVGDERISLPDFSGGLDVGTLSNRALLSAVEVCDEAGLLEG